VATVHNVYTRSKLHRRLLNRLLAQATARVIAVSDEIRADLIAQDRIDRRKVVVIHNGIDVRRVESTLTHEQARERLGIGENELALGCVARLEQQKGHRFLLEACAAALKPLWVLDRPNPLGGNLRDAEGPMLEESFVSTFVGRWSMPIRYSLSIGELATLWNAERKIGADLRVLEMQGWRRNMHWPDTGLPFVPTSPAIRDYQTALLYPGTCLIEGTNLSEGRGTKAPFRAIGAPWLDSSALAAELNRIEPTIRATEIAFVPTTRKYERQACRGVLIDVLDARKLRPVRLGLHLIATVIRLHPKEFSWSPYPTAANVDGGGHFDRLVGSPIRDRLERHQLDIEQSTSTHDWETRAKRHVLY